MIVVKTPLQLNLIGAETLSDNWANKHGGKMLAGAINKYVYTLATKSIGVFGDEQNVEQVYDLAYEGLSYRQAEQIGRDDTTLTPSRKPSFINKGGVGIIETKQGQTRIAQLALTKARFDELNVHMMVFLLKETVVSQSTPPEAQMFVLMRLVDAAEAVIYAGWWDKLGTILDQASRISGMSEYANKVYLKARVAGAFGGVLDGDYLALVVPPDKQGSVMGELKEDCVHIPFSFTPHGSHIVYSEP